jgi:PAS domain S-box-containing protein
MQSVSRGTDYFNVLLTDTTFKVRLSVLKSDTVAGEVIEHDLRHALKEQNIIMTDLHRSSYVSNVHMDILVPLSDSVQKKRIPVGVIILRIDPEKTLFPLIQSWPTPSKSSETLLIRKEDDSVIFLNELRHRHNTSLNLRLPLIESLPASMAVNGVTGLVEGLDYRNIPVVAWLADVPGFPWYMVAKTDKEEILSPLKKYVFLIILIVVLLVFINASIFGFWIWQQRIKFYRSQLKNEVSLRESEMKFRQTFDLSPIGIVMVGLDRKFLRCNNAFSYSLGYKMEELVGKNIAEVTYPDDLEIGMSEMARIAKGEFETSHVQKRYLRKDREIVWSDVLISLIRNNSGHPMYFLAIIQDITESKKVIEALRESEERFSKSFKTSPISFMIANMEDGRIIEINDAFTAISGFTREEALKSTTFDLKLWVHEQDRKEMIETLGNGNAILHKETLLRGKIGNISTVLLSAQIIKLNNSNCIISSIEDITRRREAEAEVRIQSEIMSHMAEAVYLVRMEDGIIVYANSRFEELFGYGPEEMTGRSVSILNAPTDKSPEVTEKEIMSELGKNGFWMGEVLNIKKDGTVFWSHATVAIFDHSKFGRVLVSVQNDITDRKNAEFQIKKLNEELEGRVKKRTELLEAANKELEAFSYSVSHDLRAPLRSVHGYTKILLEEYEDKLDDEGKRICGIISSSATQMGALIDDLLSFSRIGRSSLNPMLLDMKSMVTSIFADISSNVEKSRTKLKIGKLHKASGDANLIKIVWTNLISNAIKYSSKEIISEISVSSQLVYDRITYSVKDNGVGFDMNYKHKLFGVFQRLHSEAEFEGNGVGLAIVQRIILKHGGKVWAEGEVGKGATFYFSLPVEGDGQQASGDMQIKNPTPYA